MNSITRPWAGFKVVPLVVIDDPKDTKPVMDALLAGGIGIIEIALRSEKAIQAIEQAVTQGSMVVSAGTITNTLQLSQVIDTGAKFGISPAWSDSVMEYAQKHQFPFIPAIATPSEALRAFEWGYTELKLFPADVLGGEAFVKAIGSVLPEISLLPSGGVSEQNLQGYLANKNVFAVSGSWIAPRALIQEQNFEEITARAKRAMELAQ